MGELINYIIQFEYIFICYMEIGLIKIILVQIEIIVWVWLHSNVTNWLLSGTKDAFMSGHIHTYIYIYTNALDSIYLSSCTYIHIIYFIYKYINIFMYVWIIGMNSRSILYVVRAISLSSFNIVRIQWYICVRCHLSYVVSLI